MSRQASRAGFAARISFGTHLFNAMSGFHHYHPGLATALLDELSVPVGLIADGYHVDPAVLRSRSAPSGLPVSRSQPTRRPPPVRLPVAIVSAPPRSSATVRRSASQMAPWQGAPPRWSEWLCSSPGCRASDWAPPWRWPPSHRPGCSASSGGSAGSRPTAPLITILDSDGRMRLTPAGGCIAYRR